MALLTLAAVNPASRFVGKTELLWPALPVAFIEIVPSISPRHIADNAEVYPLTLCFLKSKVIRKAVRAR
jgi:hypothetical protein